MFIHFDYSPLSCYEAASAFLLEVGSARTVPALQEQAEILRLLLPFGGMDRSKGHRSRVYLTFWFV